MKKIFFIILVLIIQTSKAQVGVNLSLPERGGTYIDVIKEKYRWQNSEGNNIGSAQVDKKGWPSIDATFIWDNRPVAEWRNEVDDPEFYKLDISGSYKCSFIGDATLTSLNDGKIEDQVYNSNDNTTTFNFVVEQGGSTLVVIEFKDTKREASSDVNSGFTSFKMLRPGYDNDDKLFHQPFLDVLNEVGFAAHRYMIFTGANGSDLKYPETIKWEDRKLPTDASQARLIPINKKGRACWEHVIRLANETMTDPWINIGTSVDSNYLVELAKLFFDNLDPSLNLYLESSNEVWNTAPGFEQTNYNHRQALALGIEDHENHGRRTVEISKAFAQVYGASEINNKIRVVLSYHFPMLKWRVLPMFRYIKSNFGPPSDYIYSLSTQTYFSGGIDDGSIEEVLDRSHQSIEESIDEVGGNEAGRKQWIKMAEEWNLIGGLSSYEGGSDNGGGNRNNIGNRILAEREERMCDLYWYNLDTAFHQLGGRLAMQFNLSTGYNRFGSYGLTDDITAPYRNYKMACVKEINDNYVYNATTRTSNSKSFLSIYPNPSSELINIKFNMGKTLDVDLSIQSVLGNKIKELTNKKYPAGENILTFDLQGLDAGVYFIRVKIDNELVDVKKVILIN